MAKQVNLYEAKTQLSRLVDEAAAGAEIVIAKNGKPMARLVPPEPAKTGKREFGQWRKFMTPQERAYYRSDQFLCDWKEMDAEIERDFEESINRPIDQSATPSKKPAHVGEASRGFKWDGTSSTQALSSAHKKAPRRLGRKRAK
ncbi:MAG TPA: type II toxin-antitoxin system prevent-host-death family antitoxin [Rhizomicrobium sp.]|jgi:prevent-host-death family protein